MASSTICGMGTAVVIKATYGTHYEYGNCISLQKRTVFPACLRLTPAHTVGSHRRRIGRKGAETVVANSQQDSPDAPGVHGDKALQESAVSLAPCHTLPTATPARAIQGIGRRQAAILMAGSVIWTTSGCQFCEDAKAGDWSYGTFSGPFQWEGLCKSGPKQSPINIISERTKDGETMGVLDFVYSPSAPSILNAGHGTMQVSFPKANNVLKVRGKALQLLQFHFHAPSEHAFDGKRYAMEAHLVHCDATTKKLAVVGVMLDSSENAPPNKCLAACLAYAPREHGSSVDVPIELSPSMLIPQEKGGINGYVHYGGSLTTPPCSEDVDWFVLDAHLKISSSQVLDFMQFAGDGQSLAFNSRPVQPLGDRTVFKGP